MTSVVIVLGWAQPMPAQPPHILPAPCPVLRARLEKARELVRRQPDPTRTKVLFSGGLGEGARPPEAHIMNGWWTSNAADTLAAGVETLQEDASTTTRENAIYTMHLLRLTGHLVAPQISDANSAKDPLRLIVVTSDYHLTRSSIIFMTLFERFTTTGQVVFEFHASASPIEDFEHQMPRERSYQQYANTKVQQADVPVLDKPIDTTFLVRAGATELLRIC